MEIKKAEVEFRNALKKHDRTVEWRSAVALGSLADYVAGEARGADLVITRAAWR